MCSSLPRRAAAAFFPDFIRRSTTQICKSSSMHYTVGYTKQPCQDRVHLIASNLLFRRRHSFGDSSEREPHWQEDVSSSNTLLWSLALSRCDVTHENCDGSAAACRRRCYFCLFGNPTQKAFSSFYNDHHVRKLKQRFRQKRFSCFLVFTGLPETVLLC